MRLRIPSWPNLFWYLQYDLHFRSWWSVLLVEETGVPGENHWSVASHWQTLSHKIVSSTPRPSAKKVNTSFKNVWRTWGPALPTLLADLMIFCPLGPIGQTNFKNSALTIPCILHKTWNILWCVRWSFRVKSPQKINKIKKHDVPDLYRSLHRICFYLEFCLQLVMCQS
jgi:hypothetical protein